VEKIPIFLRVTIHISPRKEHSYKL